MTWKKKIKAVLFYLSIIFAIIAAPIVLILTSQSFQSFAIAQISESGYRVTESIPFGQLDRQKLDMYVPENGDQGGPVIVFFYGGAWKAGRRDLYRFVGAAFAKQGYTTVIPDYRLYPDVRFPIFVEDAALSYSWVWNKFNKNKDKQRPIIVIGHSAGAHIGALLSYDKSYLRKLGNDISPPSAFVGLAGPYAFDPTTWPSTKEIFATAPSADKARPVAFVDSAAPPSLLLHGLDDSTVRLWNAEDLVEKLRVSGVNGELIRLKGIGHIGIVSAIAKPLRWRSPVFDHILKFLDML